MSGNDNKNELTKASLKEKSRKNEDLIKSISLIKKFKKVLPKKSTKNNFLGRKRKLLSITKPMDLFINNSYMNINAQKCAICLENINLSERHFLHCGHFFHCPCIDAWLDMGKDKCPMCRQNIECNNRAPQNSIHLEENENSNIPRNIHGYSDIQLLLYYIIKLVIMYISNYLVISSIQQLKDIFPGILRFIIINHFFLFILN
jgi:hypothetical protein